MLVVIQMNKTSVSLKAVMVLHPRKGVQGSQKKAQAEEVQGLEAAICVCKVSCSVLSGEDVEGGNDRVKVENRGH